MRDRLMRPLAAGCLCMLALALSGCSIKTMAINKLGDALSEGTSSFATDDDPELVARRGAVRAQDHREPDRAVPEAQGPADGRRQRFHAVRLRVRPAGGGLHRGPGPGPRDRACATAPRSCTCAPVDYGLRALEVQSRGSGARFRTDPDARAGEDHEEARAAALLDTAAAWGAAFAIDKADSSLSVDQVLIEKLMRRALALDEAWEMGSLHDFFITWEGGRSSVGGSLDKAKQHFDRALGAGQRPAGLALRHLAEVDVGRRPEQEGIPGAAERGPGRRRQQGARRSAWPTSSASGARRGCSRAWTSCSSRPPRPDAWTW